MSSFNNNIDILTKETRQQAPSNLPAMHKQNASASLFEGMTSAQAEAADKLELFIKYNTTQDDVIDNDEYNAYIAEGSKGLFNDPANGERVQKGMQKVQAARADDMDAISDGAAQVVEGQLGEDVIGNVKAKMLEWSKMKSQNLDDICKSLGLDLAQYKTKEEKIQAMRDSYKEKFSTNIPEGYDMSSTEAAEGDNLYIQEMKRIRCGELTDSELKRCGLTKEESKNLSDEEVAALAKKAVELKQVENFSEKFMRADEETRQALITTIQDMDENTQSVLIVGALSLAASEGIEKRNAVVGMLNKALQSGEMDLNPKLKEHVTTIATMIAQGSDYEEISKAMQGLEGEVQSIFFQAARTVDDKKLEDKIITQEKYDENRKIEAESVHELDEADVNYQFLMERVDNLNNRDEVLNIMASYAYQIKDETQRNNVVSMMKSSQYYEQIKDSLNTSYNNYVTEQLTSGGTSTARSTGEYVTSPIDNGGYSKQVDPMIYYNTAETPQQSKQVSDTIIETIRHGSRESKDELYTKTSEALDSKNLNGQTQKYRNMQFSKGVMMLNEAIKNGDFDNSECKNIILKKIGSMDVHTLVNSIILKLSPKAQQYLIKEKVVDIPTLDVVVKLEHDLVKLPKSVQDEIRQRRQERQGTPVRPFD